MNSNILEKASVYFIHDNGGRPFKIIIKDNNIDIFACNDFNKLIKSYKNLKYIFIPKGIDTYGHIKFIDRGNTILAHISGNKYVCIAESIFEFETNNEKILEYHSPIGNSDVPYPLAVGENNIYFLIGKAQSGYVSKDYFEGFQKEYDWSTDGYSRLYGHGSFNEIKETNKIPNIKIIVKRKW